MSISESAPDDAWASLERARHDRAAFGAFYLRHHAAVAGYVHRRVGRRDVVDDIVAEVFLTALRTIPRFRWRGIPVEFWLYRIAGRLIARRRMGIIRRRTEPLGGEESREEDSACTAERERARDALLRLPERFQEVLALHYLEGLSVRDIAEVMGCREGTVKSRLSRARDVLARELERNDD